MEQKAGTQTVRMAATIGIFLWMVAIILTYLVLFGPSDFWFIAGRFGVSYPLQIFRDSIQPVLTAGYLE